MAITKAINKSTKSRAAMRNCIEYVLRENKIKDGLVFITGPYEYDAIDYDRVYQSFMREKELWKKDGGRMYAHHVISFHKDEEITPEQALEFGKEFADRWFESFGCLVSVHQDKNHIHIHFVTNSVSYIDGYKLHATKKDLEKMKQLTNDMCRERNLSVAEKGRHFDGTIIPPGFISTWNQDKYKLIKNDPKQCFIFDCIKAIMDVMKTCRDRNEFIAKMKEKGWDVNWKDSRKNITFIDESGQKVRDSNLSKTFNVNISKTSLENAFMRNNDIAKESEVDQYCTAVAEQIAPNKKDNGKKKTSIKDKLKEKQKIVDEKKKQAKRLDTNRTQRGKSFR